MCEKIKIIIEIANDGRLQITRYIWLRFATPKFYSTPLRSVPQNFRYTDSVIRHFKKGK